MIEWSFRLKNVRKKYVFNYIKQQMQKKQTKEKNK